MKGGSLKRYFPIFVLPALLSFLLVFVIPFVMGLFLSFTEFSTVESATFVGIENYVRAFDVGDGFLRSLGFTTLLALCVVLAVNFVALALALLLTKKIRATALFRGVFFLPNLIGGIVLGYIWNLLLGGVLSYFGLDITYYASLGFLGLLLLSVWQLSGYMMVIYIAALTSIPKETEQAALVDGATPFQMLRFVKLPQILPSIAVCVFLTLTNTFKMFDQNLALTQGAPNRETEMLALHIFRTFYGRIGWQGVGQAKAVLFFLVVAILSALQLYFTREKKEKI
jgi:raffinose/stachyose/melibiose transport system permease protein